jgi:prepilin-type N-terminal cleavage/methylation domain-containing protein
MLLPSSLHITKTLPKRGFTPTVKFPISEKASLTAGFTLIEMIVAVAIFTIITSVLLFNYNNFNSRLNLDILVHQIAQWGRDTQVSAMSVRPSRTNVNSFSGFGLHFDMVTPKSFIYFADLNGSKKYDPLEAGKKCGDAGVECEKVINILKGNAIEKICGYPFISGSQGLCPAGFESLSSVDAVFTRPNPDACVSGAGAGTCIYSHADITVVSPAKYRHTIQVWTTGQISVQ